MAISLQSKAGGTQGSLQINGVDSMVFDSTGIIAGGAPILTSAQASMLGIGQTWQNVSASRTNGITYTNTTTKPIYVFAWSTQGGASGGGATLTINGIIFPSMYSSSTNCTWVIQGIVPINGTYVITMTDARGGWSELR